MPSSLSRPSSYGCDKCPHHLALPDLIAGELSGDAQTIIGDVEARFKAVMERLGAKAGTQNIDRILRLPGTLKFPMRRSASVGVWLVRRA